MSEWYYMFGGQQQGPVSGSQLKSLAATGGLGPDDMVWNQSMTDWVQASRVRGLTFAARAAAHYAAPMASAAPAPAPMYAPEQAVPAESYAPLPTAVPAAYPSSAPAQALDYSQPSPEGVSPRTIDLFRQTRPWVLLLSILMFIAMGLMALAAIVMFVGVIAGSAAASRGMGGSSAPMIAGAAGGVVMVVIFLIYIALLFFPAMFLMKYASAISRLVATRRVADLEAAIEAQKSYWKFTGILTLVGIGFYVLAILIAVVGGALH